MSESKHTPGPRCDVCSGEEEYAGDVMQCGTCGKCFCSFCRQEWICEECIQEEILVATRGRETAEAATAKLATENHHLHTQAGAYAIATGAFLGWAGKWEGELKDGQWAEELEQAKSQARAMVRLAVDEQDAMEGGTP